MRLDPRDARLLDKNARSSLSVHPGLNPLAVPTLASRSPSRRLCSSDEDRKNRINSDPRHLPSGVLVQAWQVFFD